MPHVGDMGQIHQHLVLFNHVALGHEVVFLEYIPHLREYFWNLQSSRMVFIERRKRRVSPAI